MCRHVDTVWQVIDVIPRQHSLAETPANEVCPCSSLVYRPANPSSSLVPNAPPYCDSTHTEATALASTAVPVLMDPLNQLSLRVDGKVTPSSRKPRG